MHARNVQCYMMMGARTFQQFMRNVLAILILQMPSDVLAMRGVLLGAISAGHLFTQLPGGYLADAYGAKTVLGFAILASALACMLVPTAYDHAGPVGMWWCIALMGAVQGPMFPASSVFLKNWMPPAERARASTYVDVGISVGALLAVPAGSYLGQVLSWQEMYWLMGALGATFTAAWALVTANCPDTCAYISVEERDFLHAAVQSPRSSPKYRGCKVRELPPSEILPAWRCVLHPAVLSLFTAHLMFNYGGYFLTNWGPVYYAEALGADAVTAGMHLCVPHAANLLAKASNTSVADALAARGASRLTSRKFFTAACFLGPAVCLLPLYALQVSGGPLWAITAVLTVSHMFYGCSPSGYKANYLDVTVEYTGLVSGIGNTVATVMSGCSPMLVSTILQSTDGSWGAVFASIFASNAATALLFGTFASASPVEERHTHSD